MSKGVFYQVLHSLACRLLEGRIFFPLIIAVAAAWVFMEPFSRLLFNFQPENHNRFFFHLVAFLIAFVGCAILVVGLNWSYQLLASRLPHSEPVNTILNIPANARLYAGLAILIGGLALTLLVNQILPHIDTTNWTLINPKIVPTMDPVGNDFRTGLFRPPHLLLSGEKIYFLNEDGSNLTQYPPLLNLLFLPYQFFSEDTAYLIHVVLLFCANLVCLALAARWAKDFILNQSDFEPHIKNLIAWLLFVVMAVFTFTGYPFFFSIERGNYDIFALFFAMLAVNNLLYKPKQIWLQVILLSIAVHLKIYPAALFVLLLIKHGKNLILPALIINFAFLLVLGPANALTFLQIIRQNVETGFTWVGNHSGFSFATYLSWAYSSASESVDWLRSLFTVLPVVLWAVSIFWVIKQNRSAKKFLLFFMITTPLMDVVPPISHDYKSVILGPAILLLFAFLLVQSIMYSNFWEYFQLLLIVILLLVLGRSFALNPDQAVFLNHKYPVIIGFATLMLFLTRSLKDRQPDQTKMSKMV